MKYLQSGSTLRGGKYKIVGVARTEAGGITYKATDMEFATAVAIKELFMSGVTDRDNYTGSVRVIANIDSFQLQKEAFKDEARRLRKSGTVKVYDLFEENGTVYYVTDSSDGIEHEETKASQESSVDESTVMAQSPSVDESTKLSSKAGSEQTRYASSSMNEETIASSQNYNNSSSGSGNRESYNYVPPQSSKSKNLLALIIVVGVWGIAALSLLNRGCGNSYQPSPDDVDTNFVEPVDTIVDVVADTTASEPVVEETRSEKNDEVSGVPPAPKYTKTEIEVSLPEDFDDYLAGYSMAEKPYYGYVISSTEMDMDEIEVVVQEEGTRAKLKFYIDKYRMSQADKSWLPYILVEGNKVKIEYYYSGSGGYRYVITMKSLRRE